MTTLFYNNEYHKLNADGSSFTYNGSAVEVDRIKKIEHYLTLNSEVANTDNMQKYTIDTNTSIGDYIVCCAGDVAKTVHGYVMAENEPYAVFKDMHNGYYILTNESTKVSLTDDEFDKEKLGSMFICANNCPVCDKPNRVELFFSRDSPQFINVARLIMSEGYFKAIEFIVSNGLIDDVLAWYSCKLLHGKRADKQAILEKLACKIDNSTPVEEVPKVVTVDSLIAKYNAFAKALDKLLEETPALHINLQYEIYNTILNDLKALK